MRFGPDIRRTAAYVIGLGGVVLCTILLPLTLWDPTVATSSLPYLGLILAAGLIGGLAPALVTAVAAFLFFMDYVFVPAHFTFTLTDPADAVATVGFLGVSGLIAYLLQRSQHQAELAKRREHEAQNIAEMIQVVDRSEGLIPILDSIATWSVQSLGIQRCAALLPTPELRVVAHAGTPPGGNEDQPIDAAAANQAYASGSPLWSRYGNREIGYLPFLARGEAIGLLEILAEPNGPSPRLDRVWQALVHQVGLAVERARLRDASTEAEILRRSDELKSALLATVSHELGTPLALIKGATSTLMAGEVGQDPVTERELITMVHAEANRLRGLVTDLLDVSRIEGGVLCLTLGWYDLGELILESVARLRPRLGERVIEVDAAPDLLVEVDYVLIERVIDNLIDNAVRHSPVDCLVKIAVRPALAALEVTVSDQGAGIPESELERVFEKFHQVEARSGGVGLGLAICKGIVEAHRGKIWAETTTQAGHGLTVHFTLPWVPDSAPPPT